MANLDNLDADDEQAQLGRLYDTVRRELHRGRVPAAAEAAQQLLAKNPNSTSAHELMGDVLVAQGKRAQARDEYQRAMKLEPANADAERKYAEAMLMLGEAERARQLMVSGDVGAIQGAAKGDAGAAALRSIFFAGLGQLYNGDYEKGLVTTLVGLPLFGIALWGIVGLIGAALPRGEPMTTGHTVLALLGILGYGALAAWSIWDAYTTAEKR